MTVARSILLRATGGLLALALWSLPAVAGPRCIVDDPTGTPLNLRTAPNGPVIGTLANGGGVEALKVERHNGKAWALVVTSDNRTGWAFAAFLDCTKSNDTMKSAPMKPRAAPL